MGPWPTIEIGGKDLEEIELDHLDGHKGSRPVRIGNGAANHIQLVRFSFLCWFVSSFYTRTFMENCEVQFLLMDLGANFIYSQNGLYIPGSEGTCVL